MDLIQRTVLNEAARHDAAVQALGGHTQQTAERWISTEAVGGPFHSLIPLSPAADPVALRVEVEELRRRRPGPMGVLDPWSAIELDDLGFVREEREYYVRLPGPVDGAESPGELEVSRIATAEELAALERADALGFEASPPARPFRSYAPALLEDGRFSFFAGRVEGKVVSVAHAVVAAGVVGVYGVATLPGYRRRGYGRALAAVATLVRPDLPAVLEPTPVAARMYRRMGYETAGRHRAWLSGVE